MFIIFVVNLKLIDMKNMMTYPSTDIAPSIYTDFVNGVKFDICEVQPIAHNMIADSRYRFFLAIEDNFIYKYKSAEMFFAETGKTRWDMFCITKQECKDLINDFEGYYVRMQKAAKKAENPAFKITWGKKFVELKELTKRIYGKSPM